MSANLIAMQNKFLGHGDTVYDRLSQIHQAKGCISDADIEELATSFNLPKSHVRSTAKFYEELSHAAPATHSIKVCNGEACQAAGCARLERALMANLGVDGVGATNAQGVRLEHVACLGYCGCGPNVMVDGLPLSLKHDGDLNKVVAHLRDGAELGLSEPVNAIHLPAEGQPCIGMRNFGSNVVELSAARKAGIYTALEQALAADDPRAVIQETVDSGLRGRGGAGFPTGLKFQTVFEATSHGKPPHGLAAGSKARRDDEGTFAADTLTPSYPENPKYVVVNADEGDAGSYIDKEIMERDPHSLIEGTLLAAFACGAQAAYIYIRFEYPAALRIMHSALAEAKAAKLCGPNILGTGFSCELHIIKGQGAYICGEETSLLRSIEGVPALVSFKPPFPAHEGLWGCPTAVNNVETLHTLPWIVANGGKAYAKYGFGRSRGTKLVSINTRVAKPGLYEVELGTTLRQLIFDLCGGMQEGQEFQAVQVGGPLGGIFPESLLDTPLDFEAMGKAKGLLGHAGVVVYSMEDDLFQIGRGLMAFCAVESCGKCFPCRIGAVRGTELFDNIKNSGATPQRMNLLAELCETMKYGSLCALGGAIPTPIENLMEFFPQVFEKYRPE